jgi:heme A synthase
VDAVETIHRFIGYAISGGFLLMALLAAYALIRNVDAPDFFWTLLAALQVVIAVQFVVGAVLFISGERPASNGPEFLHYVYGAFFPALVLGVAHWRARRVTVAPWLIFGVAAFVCAFSTFRALQTGLGID